MTGRKYIGRKIAPKRITRPARYRKYMKSRAWFDRRERWFEDEQQQRAVVVCAVGGSRWTLADDLHHVTYERLGQENHDDLVALCRFHHEQLHQIWDASRAWRRLPRDTAAHGIIALLRTTSARCPDR